MTGQPTIKKRPRDLFAQRAANLLWTIGLLLALLLAAGNLWLRGEAIGLVEGQAAARSLALASQFAEIAGLDIAKGQLAGENDLTARFIAQPEARYLLILDAAKTPLFSKTQFTLLPEALPPAEEWLVCSGVMPNVRTWAAQGEPLLEVRMDVNRPTEVSPQTQCVGTVYLGMSLKNAISPVERLMSIALAISACVFGLAVGGMLLIAARLRAPLDRIAALTRPAAQGKLSALPAPEAFLGDTAAEQGVSQMRRLMAAALERCQTLCAQFAQASSAVMKRSETQADSFRQYISETYQIAASVEQSLRQTQAISAGAPRIRGVSESAFQAMRRMELTLKHATDTHADLTRQMGEHTKQMTLLSEKIGHIHHIVKIITTIADHTRLIAFNASIEAAGAGKYGGRFSIVATEVRRLANTVVESIEEIMSLVSSIQAAASDLLASSDTAAQKADDEARLIAEFGNALEQGIMLAQETMTAFNDLAAQMQEPETRYQPTLESLKALVRDAEHLADEYGRTHRAIAELAAQIQEAAQASPSEA